MEDTGPPPIDPMVLELVGGGLVHVIEPESERYNVGAFRAGGEAKQQPDIDVGHHLHIAQRHAVIKRDRDGKVWVRDATQFSPILGVVLRKEVAARDIINEAGEYEVRLVRLCV